MSDTPIDAAQIAALFKAYDVRGVVPGELSPDIAYLAGRALVPLRAGAGITGSRRATHRRRERQDHREERNTHTHEQERSVVASRQSRKPLCDARRGSLGVGGAWRSCYGSCSGDIASTQAGSRFGAGRSVSLARWHSPHHCWSDSSGLVPSARKVARLRSSMGYPHSVCVPSDKRRVHSGLRAQNACSLRALATLASAMALIGLDSVNIFGVKQNVVLMGRTAAMTEKGFVRSSMP